MKHEVPAQQEPTPQQRLEALRMALVSAKIESLSNDDAHMEALQTACDERSMLLRRYFSTTFGSNVAPLISQPS